MKTFLAIAATPLLVFLTATAFAGYRCECIAEGFGASQTGSVFGGYKCGDGVVCDAHQYGLNCNNGVTCSTDGFGALICSNGVSCWLADSGYNCSNGVYCNAQGLDGGIKCFGSPFAWRRNRHLLSRFPN